MQPAVNCSCTAFLEAERLLARVDRPNFANFVRVETPFLTIAARRSASLLKEGIDPDMIVDIRLGKGAIALSEATQNTLNTITAPYCRQALPPTWDTSYLPYFMPALHILAAASASGAYFVCATGAGGIIAAVAAAAAVYLLAGSAITYWRDGIEGVREYLNMFKAIEPRTSSMNMTTYCPSECTIEEHRGIDWKQTTVIEARSNHYKAEKLGSFMPSSKLARDVFSSVVISSR